MFALGSRTATGRHCSSGATAPVGPPASDDHQHDTGAAVPGVSRTYRRGDEQLPALVDFGFTLDAGDFVVVTGPSGAGKSTMLHADAPFPNPYERIDSMFEDLVRAVELPDPTAQAKARRRRDSTRAVSNMREAGNTA
ncbi:hypothetical protein [Mycobacterium sp. ITM-2016-00318]|uniref:hypothetical protein n=1 Tax=Mycobacterium sp. ITM-2016-00318 TaxID=2099693 RepID=UPI001E4D9567|nr:hypothetical protein [Mycobacterium sp. ITM-2016-00318]WNG92317.1 hypothetical protein C6A82_023380 [Mycobacterium sp. ITM-2016-00318]